jgi:hypothetical protein
VLELADRRDLGSRAARREGSSPSFPTRDKCIIYLFPIQAFIWIEAKMGKIFIFVLHSHVIIPRIE